METFFIVYLTTGIFILLANLWHNNHLYDIEDVLNAVIICFLWPVSVILTIFSMWRNRNGRSK